MRYVCGKIQTVIRLYSANSCNAHGSILSSTTLTLFEFLTETYKSYYDDDVEKNIYIYKFIKSIWISILLNQQIMCPVNQFVN